MRKLVFFTWMMLCIPLALEAAKVKGLILNTDKKPIPNFECKLLNKATGQATPAEKSNKKGEVQFDKVSSGEYVLKVAMPGYLDTSSDPITVSEEGKEFSTTLIAIDQKVYKAKEAEANELLNQSKFREAAAQYKEMLKLTPNEAVIWANLAKADAGMMDEEASLEAVKKAAALDPANYGDLKNQIQAWTNFQNGTRALAEKDYAKAVKIFSEAVKAMPTNPDGFYDLSLAYGHQRKYTEALKYIDEALKLKPNEKAYLDLKRILENNAKADQ
ncbi:MAG: tetratricopeptide repeat protein [Terriglobia bacterium]